MAHAQSNLGGAPTWVVLPRDEWPDSWKGMRNPACPLLLSLYGHPDSGGYEEQQSKGFIECSPWRSCYFHLGKKLFFTSYVDVFKIAGPEEYLEEGWRLTQEPSEGCPKGIGIDPPAKVGR